jgi:trans-aconitate 2-methyltransferase
MTDAWNPTQYERFKSERSQPFYDLLALVQPVAGMRAVDLGCGTGQLTAELCQQLRVTTCIGVDNSTAMLERADKYVSEVLTFESGDLATWSPPFAPDLIFSNAALHWIDDHATLFARLTGRLAGGGQLAVQMPMNFDHPSHVVARELEEEEPFKSRLSGPRRIGNVLTPEAYAVLLDDLGYREQLVRLQVYAHHLDGREQVIEWVKGTLLTDYEVRLGPELFALFLERYRARLLPRLRDTRPFFYPFKRILLWARR